MRHFKRAAAFVLAAVMIMSLFTATAFAEEETVTEEAVIESAEEIEEIIDGSAEDAEVPDAEITDTELLPTRVITTCELSIEVKYADTSESYENISFNIEAANYILKRIVY